MSTADILKLSVEWLLTKPMSERSYATYLDIVHHFGTVYATVIDDDLIRRAYMRLPDWQKPR